MIYRIADLLVEMETWGRTYEQAKGYEEREASEADFMIRSNAERGREKLKHLTLEDCEYLGTGENFYYKLLEYNGMMIHASAVEMEGKAYLFSADPGTGKSTHTSIWQRVYGEERVRIINDDKPAVRIMEDKVYAYGTPWSGKTDKNRNMKAEVAGICILRRGEENKIERYRGKEAILELYRQTVRSRDRKKTELIMETLNEIMKRVPVWQLICNMDDEAALVSYRAMSGKQAL